MLSKANTPRIGEILVGRRLLTPGQLADALERQRVEGGRIGEILVRLGYVQGRDLHQGLADQWRLMVAAATIAVGTMSFALAPAHRPSASACSAPMSFDAPAGTVRSTDSEATLITTSGERQTVVHGTTLHVGDIIETASGAGVAVSLPDCTTVRIDGGVSMVVDCFVYDPTPSALKRAATAGRAIVRTLSAWTSGKIEPQTGRSATIGLRG